LDEHNALEHAEILRDRRRFSAYPTPSGMVRVEGELDPEGGEAVLTALRAIVDAELRAKGWNDLITPRSAGLMPSMSWPGATCTPPIVPPWPGNALT